MGRLEITPSFYNGLLDETRALRQQVADFALARLKETIELLQEITQQIGVQTPAVPAQFGAGGGYPGAVLGDGASPGVAPVGQVYTAVRQLWQPGAVGPTPRSMQGNMMPAPYGHQAMMGMGTPGAPAGGPPSYPGATAPQ